MQVKYKNVDPKLVVNEIRNGRSIESIQKIFEIKLRSEVQDLYLRGLMELGEIPQVNFSKSNPGGFKPSRPAAALWNEKSVATPHVIIKTPSLRTIGQSGSITLNKALLIEQMGFSVGDSFEIYREGDRLVLQKTPNPH
jgi:hypothetical protein